MKKSVFIFCLILSFNTFAANTCGDDLGNNCWDCGKTVSDNCTARLDANTKKLSIIGDGNMANFYISQKYAWQDQQAIQRPWGNNIESVEISEGIKSIGQYAFYGTGLTNITIPASVESVNEAAFQSTSALTNVAFQEGSNLQKIGGGAFNNIPNLTNIDIPQSVKIIGDNAFNLSGINSITLSDTIFLNDEGDPNDDSTYFQGLSIYALSDVDHVYCSEASHLKCEEYFNQGEFWENGIYHPIKEKSTLAIYTPDGDKFYANGKWYNSLSDMNKGNYNKKRIYTIDEAQKVTGNKNRVSIKYR